MARSNGQRPKLNGHVAKKSHEGRWQKATDARPSKLRWLLPGRIVQGGLAIVEGETSVGKTTFLAALAASITTGKAWLGRSKSEPAKLLWMTGEEDFARDILPRLVAAGADPENVIIPGIDENGEPRKIFFPEGVEDLRTTIKEYGIFAVICEPLSSFVSAGVNLNDAVSCRQCLDPLQRMAIATGSTVLLTRGLRKDRSGPRTAHGQGSAAIGDTARSILSIETCDGADNRRVLRVVKCSRSPKTPALGYAIVDEGHGPVMRDLGELSASAELDNDQSADAAERGQRADARRMIRTMLATDWVRSSVMKTAAEDAMVSINTLRRAAKELAVQTRQKWEQGAGHHEWGPPEGGFAPEASIP